MGQTKRYATEDIRNIALVGHGHCGKTALGEAMLYLTGATTRLGDTSAGTSTFDFEPEEQKRGGSIASAFAWTEHDGRKLNLVDTPGDSNFIYDSYAAMRGVDSVFVVVSAPDGVEVQTERVYRAAEAMGLPRVVVINKMDRERASAERVLDDFEETLGVRPVPLQVPLGRETGFVGVVSLLQRKALRYTPDGSGHFEKVDVPADLADAVETAWETLVEAVASTDDALLETYLESFELSAEEVRDGLHRAINRGELVPAIYTSATHNIGVDALLDVSAWACPNPLERRAVARVDGDPVASRVDGPFCARVIRSFNDDFGKLSVFRVVAGTSPENGIVHNPRTGGEERLGAIYALRGTARSPVERAVAGDIVAVTKLRDTRTNDTLAEAGFRGAFEPLDYPEPMMRYTIAVISEGDEDKLKGALEKLIDEDPTLSTRFDPSSRALVLRGMGQQHLDLAVEKMARKFGVAVNTGLPHVPYRETLSRAVFGIEGRHKKQSGGAGQFGVCTIDVEPLPRGDGFEFVDAIVGAAIPKPYIPSVEKGLRQRMARGPKAGYPIVDIRVAVVDGQHHAVDSKDIAYQAAASKALKLALETGGTKLLEPMYRMEIRIPSDKMGEIMNDVTARRGRVLGMEPAGRHTVVRALCPLAEIQRYAPDLRSMTQGQGTFTMSFDKYEDLPSREERAVVEASPFDHRHEEDE